MKRKITVCLSDGTDELIFSESSPLRLLANGVSGLDSPPLDVECAAESGGRASYTRRLSLGVRTVKLSFEISELCELRPTRDKISRMMTLGHKMTLSVWYLGRCRTTQVFPYREAAYFAESMSATVCVTLTLVGAQPYFTEGIIYKSPVPHGRSISSFPLTLMPTGAALSLAGTKISANIHNPGDTDCPITVTLFADGDVVNPYVMLGDRKITLLCEMSETDRVKLTTGCGRHELSANGAKLSGASRKSRFFALPPGTSTLLINAESGATRLRACYEFEPRYLGI